MCRSFISLSFRFFLFIFFFVFSLLSGLLGHARIVQVAVVNLLNFIFNIFPFFIQPVSVDPKTFFSLIYIILCVFMLAIFRREWLLFYILSIFCFCNGILHFALNSVDFMLILMSSEFIAN